MFYLLDKPKGITSFSAIKKFAKERKIKKIGHTGTLDPMATGLLLIATDDDTKLIDYVDKGFKSYKATMLLGQTSTTYDIEGEILETKNVDLSEEDIKEALTSFVGKQSQMPPAFSAKRINGKRAYDLARQGKEVVLNACEIEITKIENITFLSNKEISFDVEVSRGTYIRSLIHDLGTKLGVGAVMSGLRRISIGPLNWKELK